MYIEILIVTREIVFFHSSFCKKQMYSFIVISVITEQLMFDEVNNIMIRLGLTKEMSKSGSLISRVKVCQFMDFLTLISYRSVNHRILKLTFFY